MHTQKLLPLCGLLLAGVGMASKLDHDDVPNRCWAACGPVVGVAKSCDAKHERDSAEIQCICDWDAAKTQIPLCSACITQYQDDRRNNTTHKDHDHDDDDSDSDDDDDDNEALDLVHSCSLTTTTYNSAAATTLSGTATGTASTGTVTSNIATVIDSTTNGGTKSQDATGSASPGSSDAAVTSSGSASSPTPTPDAAVGISAPSAASMAGVMGLIALVWL